MNTIFDNKWDTQSVLNQILLEFMREQKRKRHGRWIFRGLILLALGAFIFSQSGWSTGQSLIVDKDKPHAGLIDIDGTIFDTEAADADNFLKGMTAAYQSKGLKALILRINSPGGSPVQADYMYNAIRFFQKKYPEVKTYAVCVDICASAAYYVASAADEIYANPASMVGSIGVLYNGFGFTKSMEKIGVERRLRTAGINKAFLDPFSPEEPTQQAFLQSMLDDVHQRFIHQVKKGRGNRLKIDDLTFSGLFWTGRQAKERGLIDGFASAGELVRNQIKVKQFIDYTHQTSVLEKFSKGLNEMAKNPLGVLSLGQSQGQMNRLIAVN